MEKIIQTFIEKKFLDGKNLESPDEALFSNGTIDSLGVLELIAFLEKQFHVIIDTQEHELTEFDTVGRIVHLVETLSHHAPRS